MAYASFIGIDPGLTGGIVVLDPAGRVAHKQAVSRRADGELDVGGMRELAAFASGPAGGPPLLVVEHVWAFSGQGVSSSFTFGKVTGVATGAAEAYLGVPARKAAPRTWQRAVLGPCGDTKAAAREFVVRRWPGESFRATDRSRRPHPGLVDAACIAEYARLFSHELGDV